MSNTIKRTPQCCDDPHSEYHGGLNKFNNVIVGYNGIILSSDGTYIQNANSHFEYWYNNWEKRFRNAKLLDDINNLYKTSIVKKIDEPGLVLNINYFKNYPFGHIWDNIQSLLQFKNNAPYKLLCSSIDGTNLDYHFSLFGFNSNNRYHIDNSLTLYSVKELIVPQLEMFPAHISKRHFHTIRNTYLSNITIKENTPRIIFATRTKTRVAINAKELEKFCSLYDIKIVDGTEKFEDLVSYFYNAKLILGIHGSLLKHCIFSNNAKIIEFAPETRGDHSHKQNSSFVSNDYEIIKLPCNDKFEINIPLDLLKKVCDEI